MKSKRNAAGDKLRECVRPLKVELDREGFETPDAYRAAFRRWMELSRVCQEAANMLFETWLVWHVQNGSAKAIAAWLSQRSDVYTAAERDGTSKEIVKATLKEIGNCPVICFPPELNKLVDQTLTRAFPQITNTSIAQLQQTLKSKFQTDKAKDGSLSRWMAVLLHRERFPSFTSGIPIPLHNKTTELVKDGDNYFLEFRTWRVPVAGRKTATSVLDRVRLRLDGRKCQQERTMMAKVASGEWPMKGVQLLFDARNGKWMAVIGHQRTSHVAEIKSGKTAYLIAGHKNAFSIFYHDGRQWRRHWLQGRGLHIVNTRRRLWEYRAERNANYSHATARKGRGQNNSHRWRAKSSETWKFFVRRVNHAVSKSATEWCVANGYGTLVYKQPCGRYAESRFVSGEFKNSTWEFYQLGTLVQYKCQDRGIECKVQKVEGKNPQTGPSRKTA